MRLIAYPLQNKRRPAAVNQKVVCASDVKPSARWTTVGMDVQDDGMPTEAAPVNAMPIAQTAAPTKKKKLGKKERERLKAAKEREEAEKKAAVERATAEKAARLLKDHSSAAGRVGGKSKRKSRKRRMYESQARSL